MDDTNTGKGLTIAISGASGFLGTLLCEALTKRGDKIIRLVRHKTDKPDEIYWEPSLNYIDPVKLENIDVVINLSGLNIASKRWNANQKTALKESRIKSTHLLASALGRLKKPPKLFLSASAMGYYGNTGNKIIDESAPAGSGFLAQLSREWELATWPAEAIGIRVNQLRIGMVLGTEGGALKSICPAIRSGFGAILGSGDQFVSWISARDFTRAVIFLIENPQPAGPLNLVSPKATTHGELMRTLARVLKRPMWLKIPPKLVRLLFGEMGETLFLDSIRIEPKALVSKGFQFLDIDLETTLRELFKK